MSIVYCSRNVCNAKKNLINAKQNIYSPTHIPQIQRGNIICLSMLCSNVKKINETSYLFSRLSVQLLMVLIADLDCKLLTCGLVL